MKTLLSSVLFLFLSSICFGQVVYQDNWMKPNGPVNSILQIGNTVYLGGEFTYMGWIRKYGVAFDKSTGSPDLNNLSPNGIVRAAIPDGLGGWYIGGSFTTIGGQARYYIARINADGTLNSWNPGANGDVNALAVSGNIVFAGGGFTAIGGQSRSHAAAIDANTGAVTSWNLGAIPNQGPGGTNPPSSIYALLVHGNTLYIGGYFYSTINGQNRHGLAAADITTAALTSWNPNIPGTVYSIAISGNTIYAGGSFQSVGGIPSAGGLPRSNLAAIDITTGGATSWNANTNGDVLALALAGGRLYSGGKFSTVSGQACGCLVSIDTSTGSFTDFNVYNSIFMPSCVYSLAVSGDTVYVGGSFTQAGGQSRNNLAAIDATTANFTSWSPYVSNASAPPYNGPYIAAVAVSGNSVYAGGDFDYVGAQQRNHLAAIDVTSGMTTSWNPDADGNVSVLLNSSNTIYTGGYFGKIGGQTRHHLAAINAISGMPTAWNPNVLNVGAPYAANVSDLALLGNTLYAAGYFNTVGGQSRNYMAAVDTITGTPTSWNPNPNDEVTSLAVSANTVYAGGSFSDMGGVTRHYLAALDPLTGVPTTWNPDVVNSNQFLTGKVLCLAISGNNVYTGGTFTSIGGQARHNLAAVDMTTGVPTSWNPNPNNNYVDLLAVLGNTLYVAGEFTSIAGQGRDHIGSIDIPSGALTPWNLYIYNVRAIASTNNITYLGGDFAVAAIPGNGSRRYFIPVSDSLVYVRAAIAASDTTVCYGTSVSFTSTISNGGANPSYQWLKNGDSIPGATNSGYSSSTLSPFDTIVCQVTSSNLPNYSNYSNAIVMNVSYCTPIILSLTPPASLCKGGTMDISFGANGFAAGNIFTAQLSNATGSFSNPTILGTLNGANGGVIQATISATQAAGSGYRIRIISSSPSMTGPDNGTNLTVAARPTNAQVAITPTGAAAFCPGETVTIAVPNTAGFSFQWKTGANPIAGATTHSYAVSAAATYSAIVTNAAGCSRNTANKIVTAATAPVATILPSTAQSICSGSTVTFSANTGTGLTYQWRKNNTNITGATNDNYTASTVGNYYVVVTNSGGCKDTSDQVNVFQSCGATITTSGTIKKCSGDTIAVQYTAAGNTAGNIFSLQLSDGGGSFTNAVIIGTLNSTTGGTIVGTIPAGTNAGTGYKLRILSSSPASTGPASSLTINVQNPIIVPIGLCAVTVDSATGKNLLIWNKPLSTIIDSFFLYRRPDLGANFVRIGAQSYSTFSTFLDASSSPSQRSNRYYLTAGNVCGETPISTVHTTMHLTINKGKNNTTWNLIWNGYEGFTHYNYTIWRGTSATNMTPLTTIEAREYNSYTDASAPAGAIFYKISVTDGPACNPTARTTGQGLSITSNIASNDEGVLPQWMDMNVYPNPSIAGGELTIQSSLNDEVFKVRITDVMGRVVEQMDAMTGKAVPFGTFLAPGVYTVEATGAGNRIVRKWVKQ